MIFQLSCLAAYGQKDSVIKMSRREFGSHFEEGNLMIMEQFYDTALSTFLLLHRAQPDNANINYKVGYLYLQIPTEKTKAIPYLEKAVLNMTHNYHEFEPSEKKAPETALYYLAQAYHLDYRFDKAIEMYNKFGALVPEKNTDIHNDIGHRIEMCSTGKELSNVPMGCVITNLGDSVNSVYPDYGPVISADESVLYFTSRRPGTGGMDNRSLQGEFFEDIWECDKKEDGTWGQAHGIGATINTLGHEAAVGLSADGQTLFIYKDDNGDGNIYQSQLNGDAWSYPEKMDDNINSKSWEPSACLSPDGNTIYFVSDRKGGFGGRDIWRCVKLPNNKWSLPTNLGPKINTPYDEEAPFIHPDGVTLFFASKGHKTMGGFDIFFSTLTDSGWTNPQNMGYPVNTTDDDVFYVMSADGKRAYFSSFREGGKGEKDIYMVTIPQSIAEPVLVFVGYIKNTNGQPLSSEHGIHITYPNGEIKDFRANTKTGKYVLPLKAGATYKMDVEVDGKPVHQREIEAPNIESDQEILLTTIWLGPSGKADTLVKEEKFFSASGNIFYNDTKKPMGNIAVTLLVNGEVLDEISSGESGGYSFSHLDPQKSYVIRASVDEIMLSPTSTLKVIGSDGKEIRTRRSPVGYGFKYELPTAEKNSITLTAKKSDIGLGKNGSHPVKATLCGKLYLDRKGTKGAGFSVKLMQNGHTLQSISTNEFAMFCFEGLEATELYDIVVVEPAPSPQEGRYYLADMSGRLVRRNTTKKQENLFKDVPTKLSSLPTYSETALAKNTSTGKNTNTGKNTGSNNTTNNTTNTNTTTTTNTGKNTPPITEFEPDTSTADFSQHFTYNRKKLDLTNPKFSQLIDKIAAAVAASGDGQVQVLVRGCASKVPFRRGSNLALALGRSQLCASAITQALKEKGVDLKKVKLRAKYKIDGPRYAGDAVENHAKYEKYQYVKVYVSTGSAPISSK